MYEIPHRPSNEDFTEAAEAIVADLKPFPMTGAQARNLADSIAALLDLRQRERDADVYNQRRP